MGDRTAIQWTDASWNPLAAFDRVTGKRGWFCTKVSDGCTNCYAEGLNVRLGTGHRYRVPNLEKIEFRTVNLDQPLRWRRPRRIFVNSMTDLFHEAVPFELVDQVFAAMATADHHTFQILTKRPGRMREYMAGRDWGEATNAFVHEYVRPLDGDLHLGGEIVPPLPNVWLGTSVEDQAAADARIPELIKTPAAVRFLSCEPLLGPIDFGAVPIGSHWCLVSIDWVIIGGESGAKARPFSLEAARSLVESCRTFEIPVFVKQLGRRPVEPCPNLASWPDHVRWRSIDLPDGTQSGEAVLKDKKGGDWSEWQRALRVREFPTEVAAYA